LHNLTLHSSPLFHNRIRHKQGCAANGSQHMLLLLSFNAKAIPSTNSNSATSPLRGYLFSVIFLFCFGRSPLVSGMTVKTVCCLQAHKKQVGGFSREEQKKLVEKMRSRDRDQRTSIPKNSEATKGKGMFPAAPQVEKIIGGTEATPFARPWMVSLQTADNFHFCGGSLIAPNVVSFVLKWRCAPSKYNVHVMRF
jgi:hypothetical protein